MGMIERALRTAHASPSRDEVLSAALGSGLSLEMMVERLLDKLSERHP